MLVSCVPLTDFLHGSITAHEGRRLQMEEGLAGDLERAGLIRIEIAQTQTSKAAPGKEPDDGKGQPSSASQAAPASPTTTLHVAKRGETAIQRPAK